MCIRTYDSCTADYEQQLHLQTFSFIQRNATTRLVVTMAIILHKRFPPTCEYVFFRDLRVLLSTKYANGSNFVNGIHLRQSTRGQTLARL